MTPYAAFAYFGLLLYPTIPAVWIGLAGRITRWFVLTVTLLMLALQYDLLLSIGTAVSARPFVVLMLYALFQGALVKGYLAAHSSRPGPWLDRAAVVLSLVPLLGYKLLPAVGLPDVFGFLGISYLTFRSLDVIFGIHDGLIKQIALRDFWLFLLFFPSIAAGPVDRYRRFQKDWEKPRSRAEYLADVDLAVDRFFRGLLYKFVVAQVIRAYIMEPVAGSRTVPAMTIYMYGYSAYLFFDFAGYSAFAVAVSRLFGVHAPENFDKPFLSQNIRDFWNRWHISLSWWFRDHVYMRFVMAATKRKLFANKYATSYLGFTLSMGLMGLWHGLQWHYIVYGLYHAALIIGYDYVSRWNKERKVWGSGPLWRSLGVAITVQTVCFGLLIFSGHLF